jgi:hypothetical protein
LRVAEGAIWTGIITHPIGAIEPVVVVGGIGDGGLIAGGDAEAVGVILIVSGWTAANALKGAAIVVPEGVGPGAGGDAGTRIGVSVLGGAVVGAGA